MIDLYLLVPCLEIRYWLRNTRLGVYLIAQAPNYSSTCLIDVAAGDTVHCDLNARLPLSDRRAGDVEEYVRLLGPPWLTSWTALCCLIDSMCRLTLSIDQFTPADVLAADGTAGRSTE